MRTKMPTVGRADDDRIFVYAVAASVVLHALLLLAVRFPTREDSSSMPASRSAIVTRLVQAPAPSEKSGSEPKRDKPVMRGLTAAVVPKEESAPRAEPIPAAEVPDAGSIARYRQQLIGIAVRYKRYPAQALEEGREGGVVVRVSVSVAGAVEVGVKSSSGHELLDAQALEMFRAAAPQVPLPPALLGQTFGIEVRAVYSLND